MATEKTESNSKSSEEPRKARQAILTAARRVQMRDGVAGLSIAAVAKEAGVTSEAVTGHFQNAQEFLLAIAADDLASLARSAQGENDQQPKPKNEPQPGKSETQPAKSDGQASKTEMQNLPRENIRKKAILPAPLEQVMRDVVPDPEKDAILTGAMSRLERRVQVMEKAFADIVERHEKSLRERSGSLASVEESITAMLARMDSTDKLYAETNAEMRNALSDAKTRLNALEEAKLAPSSAAFPSSPEPLTLDMPQIVGVSKPADIADIRLSEEPVKMDAKAQEPGKAAANESYLSAARRAANAAATAPDEGAVSKRDFRARRSNRAKFLLFACLAPVAILGTAFMVLNRNPVTADPVDVSQAVAQVPEATQTQATEQAAPSEGTTPPPVPSLPQGAALQPANPPSQFGSAASLASLTEQAQAGDAKAARDVGLRYLAGDGTHVDESEAAHWLMRAAYKGEPTAEYWLATLYARGHGVPADAFQANHWYEAAAKKGNRRAMHSLAVANFQGWGKEKNFVEAARWFEQAAELGFVDSMFNVAVLYERGTGVPQSLTDAYKWYAIAAAYGDKEADARVAVLATQLRPADLALAQSAASSFKPMPMDETANLPAGPGQSPGG